MVASNQVMDPERATRETGADVHSAEDALFIFEQGETHEFVEGRCAHCELTEDDYTDALIFTGEEVMCPRPCRCVACVGVQQLQWLAVASVILIGVLVLIVYIFGWRLA